MTDSLVPTSPRKRGARKRADTSVSPRGLFDDVEPTGSRRFMIAAIRAFAQRGYHATTTREIAALSESSATGMYTYFSTKEDLFFRIASITHRHIVQQLQDAVAADSHPVEQMRRLVEVSVLYHAEEQLVAYVVNSNFRYLDDMRRKEIIAMRRSVSALVRDVLERGTESGDFVVDDVQGTTIAILRMVDVASWYNADGPKSPADLAEVYVRLIMRMLGAESRGVSGGESRN